MPTLLRWRQAPLIVAMSMLLPVCSRASAGQDERALLDLVVNQMPKGQVLVIIRGDDVWIGVDTLERADLHQFGGDRQVQNGIAWVRLGSLAPAVTFALKEEDLSLALTVRPELLGVNRLQLQTDRPSGLVYGRDRSAFVNYALNWDGASRPGVFADTGVSLGGALAATTLSHRADRRLVRGQTGVTFDDREKLRRWVVGDAFANTGPLGGAAFLGGISVSREYGLDPYFRRYPTLDMSGAVLTPSTLEVYVNDRLVRREDLAPGRFDVTAIPASTGRGVARLVVRDAFGREQELVSSFYLTTGVLRRGLQEYSYHVGAQRLDESTASWKYDAPILMGRHRFGLTDHLTVGFRAEAAEHMASGGPTVNIRLPVGELEVAGATSRDGSQSGVAGSFGYSFTSRILGTGTLLRYLSPGYATVSSRSEAFRTRLESSAYAAVPLGARLTLTARHTFAERLDQTAASITSLLASVRVSQRANLYVTTSHNWSDPQAGRQLFAGLGVLLGTRTTANMSLSASGGSTHPSFDLQQSLPLGTGYGYRVANDLDRAHGTGTVQYQGPYGRYEVWHDVVDGAHATSLRAAGGIVAIGGRVFATRPVQNGFALIRIPDVPGVRAYASNQEVGRTDRRGNLLVPGLLPYYGNKLSIADEDIPLDRAIGDKERTIAPPYRGGALLTFPVRRLQTTRGRVVLDDGIETVVPAFGQLTVYANGQSFESPIGEDGEFYLENLPPGRYRADVLHRQRVCAFTLEVPAGSGTINLGTVSCAAVRTDQP